MFTQYFRTNRAAFSQAELDRYQGQWVAFNAEGNRILAWGDDIGQIEARLLAQGNNPSDVALERIPSPDDDSMWSPSVEEIISWISRQPLEKVKRPQVTGRDSPPEVSIAKEFEHRTTLTAQEKNL